MKKMFVIPSFIIIFLSISPISTIYAYQHDSIINNVLQSRKAIVHIRSIKSSIHKSPSASAAINPKTGRLLIARNIKSANFIKVGAGVIIDPTGLIVTNLHTVKFANKVFVKLYNEVVMNAKVVHLMPQHDLALIKIIPPFSLTKVKFANSNWVKLGDEVIHIGTSELLKETISGGKVTHLGVSYTPRKIVELIQVNINIYKGDSGGPLLNNRGQLIGMMVAKLRSRDKSSLAIPSNKIKKLYLDFTK